MKPAASRTVSRIIPINANNAALLRLMLEVYAYAEDSRAALPSRAYRLLSTEPRALASGLLQAAWRPLANARGSVPGAAFIHFHVAHPQLGAWRRSLFLEQFEIALAAHARSAVFDDEHRHGMVGRNHERALHARLDVDAMVPILAVEAEPVLFEHADEALEVNRSDSGHGCYLMLIVRRSTETNSGARQPSPSGL